MVQNDVSMKANDVLVSIVTPTYNSIRFIEDTYGSICGQTHSVWEWLVTDDCSTDGTWEYLIGISELDSRVKVARNDVNMGAAHSRNRSIARATGEFIAFLDSDDLWVKCKLQEQLETMLEKRLNFSFTAYELISETGERLAKRVDCRPGSSYFYTDMLRKKATLGCSTVMLRCAAYSNIEMPEIRTGQDYALWLKLLRNGGSAFLMGEVFTYYRIVDGSISRNKFRKAQRQWQIYRELEGLGLFTSTICFFFYAFRAIFR